MDYTFKISAVVDTTNPSIPLGFEMWVNGNLVHDIDHVTSATTLSYDMPDEDDKSHELKFVLKNKLPEHTKIDEQNNILSDALLSIADIEFDSIKLGHLFNQVTEYCHDYNGTGNIVTEPFNGFMGCNGTVTLKFTTPSYLWLLENM